LKNPDIKNWSYLKNQYNKMVQWKLKNFNPRFQEAKATWDEEQRKALTSSLRNKSVLQKTFSHNVP
jgi:hypothetical protein